MSAIVGYVGELVVVVVVVVVVGRSKGNILESGLLLNGGILPATVNMRLEKVIWTEAG